MESRKVYVCKEEFERINTLSGQKTALCLTKEDGKNEYYSLSKTGDTFTCQTFSRSKSFNVLRQDIILI